MLARSNNQEYQRSIVNTLVFFFVLFLDSVTGQNNFNILNLV